MRTACALALSILSATAFGQSQPPRTSDGHPDFQGIYEFVTFTPLQRPKEFEGKPFLTDAEAAEYVARRFATLNGDRRGATAAADLAGAYNEFWYERATDMMKVRRRYLTSRIIDPPDGRVPALTPAARQRVADSPSAAGPSRLDGPESMGLPARCLSPTPVISPGGEANLLQIVQTADYFAVYTELMSVLRLTSLRRATHLPQSMRFRSGDAIGRWEGDTLVVDTTNFAGPYGFDYAAIDDNLHLIERFSRSGDRDVLYEVTIDDPTAYVQPWTSALVLRRTEARMFEFACHEGNYSMRHVLSGARVLEEQARKKQ